MAGNQLQLYVENKEDDSKSITPLTVTAGDVADLLVHFESLLRHALAESEGTSPTKRQALKQTPILPFVELRSGSLDLRFADPTGQYETILRMISAAITTGDYSATPPSALRQLREIYKRVQSFAGQFALGVVIKQQVERLATVSSETEIGDPVTYTAPTTLHGVLVTAGGKGEKPNIHIETAGGRQVRCEFQGTMHERRQKVRAMAPFIYQWVRLNGSATFAVFNDEIIEFLVTDGVPMADRKFSDSLRDLASVSGVDFAAIDDVDEYVRGLRGE